MFAGVGFFLSVGSSKIEPDGICGLSEEGEQTDFQGSGRLGFGVLPVWTAQIQLNIE